MSEKHQKQITLAGNKCMWNICKDITGHTDKISDIGIKDNPKNIQNSTMFVNNK